MEINRLFYFYFILFFRCSKSIYICFIFKFKFLIYKLFIFLNKNIVDTAIDDNQESSLNPITPEENNHPTGIILRRVGYYTIPPMNELAELVDEDGSCFVDGFTIGRYDYGNVYFPERFNVAGLDIDSIGEILYYYLNSNFIY